MGFGFVGKEATECGKNDDWRDMEESSVGSEAEGGRVRM